MKNNLLFLLALAAVLSFSSCKKKVETCKLGKSYASDGSTTPNPNIFSYYSDGKLQKIVYADRTRDTLSYSADSIFIRTIDNFGMSTALFSGVLNSNGSVVSGTKAFLNPSGAVTGTEDYALEYNSAGQLTQKTITNSLGATVLSLNYDGSNTKNGTLYIAGLLDRRYEFHHSTAENKTNIDDMNGVFTPYFGKPSTNLLDSTYIITASDTIRVQYAHTLDANEYVSKTVQTFLSHETDTKYFTYQYFDCNK
jgi:hypothetical protein